MAVYHDLAEAHSAVEELFANPKQIFRLLVLKRDTGPHAGVTKEIITK